VQPLTSADHVHTSGDLTAIAAVPACIAVHRGKTRNYRGISRARGARVAGPPL